MNANEMADLLILFDSGRIYEHAEEIAAMIRQQQEKLTKYELRHVAQRDRIAILEMQHKQQQAEIEALKAKTLTDEEIAKLADDILGYQIYGYKESGVYEFARAILRKAQEG